MDINGKSITAPLLALLALLALLLCACDNDEREPVFYGESAFVGERLTGWLDGFGVTGQKVTIGDDEFDLSGQPGVSIHIGLDNHSLVNIYLQRMHVRQGYRVRSKRANHSEMVLSAAWQGLEYVESGTHPTYVSVMIRSITPEEAVLYVSARLVNLASGKLLTVSPSVIKIHGENLRRFRASN